MKYNKYDQLHDIDTSQVKYAGNSAAVQAQDSLATALANEELRTIVGGRKEDITDFLWAGGLFYSPILHGPLRG